MHLRRLASSFAITSALALTACSALPGFSSDEDESLRRVDELLTRIERVQVESVLAQEKARTALESLRALAEPEFRGDAKAAHQKLTASIQQSKSQAQRLGACIAPMRSSAEALFANWTADLESFGNSKVRLRSQARLEETRSRYEDVLTAAVSAQLAYDAYNADLHDQARFLAHDLNSFSVSMITDEVDTLRDQERELDVRLSATVAAAKEYVGTSAILGEVDGGPSAEKPKAETPRSSTRRSKTTPPPPPPVETLEAPKPAPEKPVEGNN